MCIRDSTYQTLDAFDIVMHSLDTLPHIAGDNTGLEKPSPSSNEDKLTPESPNEAVIEEEDEAEKHFKEFENWL